MPVGALMYLWALFTAFVETVHGGSIQQSRGSGRKEASRAASQPPSSSLCLSHEGDAARRRPGAAPDCAKPSRRTLLLQPRNVIRQRDSRNKWLLLPYATSCALRTTGNALIPTSLCGDLGSRGHERSRVRRVTTALLYLSLFFNRRSTLITGIFHTRGRKVGPWYLGDKNNHYDIVYAL